MRTYRIIIVTFFLGVLFWPNSLFAQMEETSPLIGKQAAYFSLPNLDGKEIRITDYIGKVVVVDFWATWCGPCRMEIPDFIQLQTELGSKGFAMLGVSLDQAGPAVVRRFVSDNGINYPIVMGDEDVVQKYGNIEIIPTTFIIDKKGIIRAHFMGLRPKEVFEAEVKKLLSEQ